ncbi:hypothetical protein P154DRAFT_516712 [Amniculicola lignicola CBS 123094]|uniref:Transcription factor Rba50 n=1 Tax=Amniculicola lignicola CBS 123094 TaxID=1392246 RepID=A0A6A5X4P9_9PLEO|nr:hypothetical protein P154DRAFT_516712 [Amniculicola lignicola CBS 123094]
MSFARGERVYFDLDSGTVNDAETNEKEAPPPPTAASAFVGEILERDTSSANPPTAPTLKTNATGFPAHKKRVNRVSAFKQQRAATATKPTAPPLSKAPKQGSGTVSDDDRRRIDEENTQRIAAMSAEEIEEERQELFSSLPPGLLQRFLGRANLDDGSNERDFQLEPDLPPTDVAEMEVKPKVHSNKKVTFAESTTQSSTSTFERPSTGAAPEDSVPPKTDLDSDKPPLELGQLPNTVHFPKPPEAPEPDPDSPNFLKDLHQKYFPNLSYDPSSLSWMQPVDPTDKKSPYHPSQTAFNPDELRFDFKGSLLAPSRAREMATTLGLHHHADAPEAAGYTVPELALLARSAVATQRCIAYQTLGRILYRLGKGEYGRDKGPDISDGPARIAINPDAQEEEEENEVVEDMDEASAAMATGLWKCIEEGRVIETLTEEANKERGHLTARAYAQEALWNWRRGGGRQRQAV